MSSVITLSDARFCFLSLCTGKQATLTCTQGIKMLLLWNTRSQSPSVGSRRGLFGLQNKFFIVWGHRLVFFFSLCSQSLVTPAETNPVVVSLYFIASSCDISFFCRPILLQSWSFMIPLWFPLWQFKIQVLFSTHAYHTSQRSQWLLLHLEAFQLVLYCHFVSGHQHRGYYNYNPSCVLRILFTLYCSLLFEKQEDVEIVLSYKYNLLLFC